jgi:putative tricarboxylic transport membrane protein
MSSMHQADKVDEAEAAGRPAPPAVVARLLPTLLPIGLLVASLVLPSYMFDEEQTLEIVGLGPAAWPAAMLWGLAFFSVLWILRDIWVLMRPDKAPTLSIPQEDEHYHFGKALLGLLVIVAYGWLLPITGFAVATATFITVWCLLGGLRSPKIVIPVTLIGTIALLWLFMGLALMPLPRGAGVFGEFSIWLLRTTGIY